jgi:hypothetical protein
MDWSEDHHDVCVMDGTEDPAGEPSPPGRVGRNGFMSWSQNMSTIPVMWWWVSKPGMWVHALTTAGYRVYAINPMAVSRYRDRHNLAGAKSDQGDAKVLADLVRTDRHNHRPIAGDTPDVEASSATVSPLTSPSTSRRNRMRWCSPPRGENRYASRTGAGGSGVRPVRHRRCRRV